MLTKQLTDVQVKDAEKGTVSAVFATLNVVDKDGDVTLPGAFTKDAQVVISAYGHQSWDGALPVGKGVIREDGDQAILEGQFFLDTVAGADTFRTVKHLSQAGLQEWSYSLQNVTSELGEHDGKQVRFLKQIAVKEVSPVLVGAGVNTRTLAVKNGDLTFSDHREAVLTAIDEVTARALEVVTLRVEQGKSAQSALDLHQQMIDRAAAFKSQLDGLLTPRINNDDLTREFARFVAATQGVTL